MEEKDNGPCPLCQLPIGTIRCFNSHTELNGVMYRCKLCTYESDYKQRMKRHARIHTGEKPYSCPHCHLRWAHKEAMQRHIANTHKGMRSLVSIVANVVILQICLHNECTTGPHVVITSAEIDKGKHYYQVLDIQFL